jgi:type II secretory pathway component PulF
VFGSFESRRAALYRQLAALESAGIPLRTAVERLEDPLMRAIAAALDDGAAPGDAWARAPFSPLEIALVKAGTKSGQLVETFHSLEQIFELRASSRRKLALGLAYPVLLLHLVGLFPHIAELVTDGFFKYLRHTYPPFVVGYAGLFAFLVLARTAKKAVPALADGVVAAIPVVGSLAKKGALVHALQAFLALYRAGVPVRDSAEGARDASDFYPVGAAFDRVRQRLDDGAGIGDAFQDPYFPVDVREAAATGALTGKLEDTLGGARRTLEDQAATQRAFLLWAIPMIVYLGAALAVGYAVVSFWSGYFDQINAMMK